MHILRFCFQKRMLFLVVTMLVASSATTRGRSWRSRPIPELSDVTVQVTTQVPGLAAEEIEQQITTPLERGLPARRVWSACAPAARSGCR
jgi:cobalt-zinc-cadmium resistance protein CzcA